MTEASDRMKAMQAQEELTIIGSTLEEMMQRCIRQWVDSENPRDADLSHATMRSIVELRRILENVIARPDRQSKLQGE